MRRWTALLTVALTVVAVGACGDDEEAEPAGTTIDLTAQEYAFQGVPSQVKGGTVTLNLRNDGKEAHEAAILQVTQGKTVPDAIEAFKAQNPEEFVLPEFVEANGGVVSIKPGETKTANVNIPEAGNFAFVCFVSQGDTGQEQGGPEEGGGQPEGALPLQLISAQQEPTTTQPPATQPPVTQPPATQPPATRPPATQPPATTQTSSTTTTTTPRQEEPQGPPHAFLGMVSPFTVSELGPTTALGADATITAKEYSFDVPTLEAGKHTLEFRNEGPKQVHNGAFVEFAPGVNQDQAQQIARALLQAEETGQPPPPGTTEPEDVGEVTPFSPGRSGTFELELQSDRTYAVLCFVSDRGGGPPHVAQGMLNFFQIQ